MAQRTTGQYSEYVYNDREDKNRQSQEDDIDLRPYDKEYEEDGIDTSSNISSAGAKKTNRSEKNRRRSKYDSNDYALPDTSDDESPGASKSREYIASKKKTETSESSTPWKRCKIVAGIVIGFFSICIIAFVAVYLIKSNTELTFIKVKHAHCGQLSYGGYKTLQNAKTSCRLDELCESVLVKYCNETGPFQLCPRDSKNIEAVSKSCLWEKIKTSDTNGEWDYKVDSGTQFNITHPSNMKIRFCSVNPPFNAPVVHFSIPADEEHPNVLSTDQGRIKLDNRNKNQCKVVVSDSRVKDDGNWKVVIGSGIRDKYEENVFNYQIKVNPKKTDAKSPVVMQIHRLGANFKRSWREYRDGFGSSQGKEYWLGLEQIHKITALGNHSLKIVLKENGETNKILHWSSFSVGDEANGYKLSIDGFNSGSTGLRDQLGTHHNGNPFSTLDRDNDNTKSDCSKKYGENTGWWFNECRTSNLNLAEYRSNDRTYKKYDGSEMIIDG